MDLAALDGAFEEVDEGSVAATHLSDPGAFGLVLLLLLCSLLPIAGALLTIPCGRGHVAAALYTHNASQ